MMVEQFVMAYKVEQDCLRAMLPEGFESLRPVLRINAEIRKLNHEETVHLEINTPVEAAQKRGWLNIASWESATTDLHYERVGATVAFQCPFLNIAYTRVGVEGGCPAEKDNDGCFFLGHQAEFRPTEVIDRNREFCDCTFAWNYAQGDAHGISEGSKSIAAFSTEPQRTYARQAFSAQSAAAISCEQVLGAYVVQFER